MNITTDITSSVEQLASSIDDVETALEPLLSTAIADYTAQLPLLDRAKAYVLAAYTIESLLYSSLRLSGQDAKSHPVFTELQRVRQRFEKIKEVEAGDTQPSMALDKSAAQRFISAALAGNDKIDKEIAEAKAGQEERLKAKIEALGGKAEKKNSEKVKRRKERDARKAKKAAKGDGAGN
ncbi:hypothetical protein EJ06DRAFT_150303 [Trichodelitschia bisporula]|uniref:Exosome complex protein n=1 Tax=Trichodelitschia bisporula TaxID=703511 RepID=A0A6G1HNH8_9PEZI|nr:hypothetical protein EJ06DRAFT_150303 [Trichodelitschia bisporula]